MTCHQSHNIPWQGLSDCYSFKDTLLLKGIAKKSKGFDEVVEPYRKKIQHFIKCFKSTIEEFAETERNKYTEKEVHNVEKLFTNEDCSNDDGMNHRDYMELDSPLQDYKYWKTIDWNSGSALSTEACVIKILFNRGKMLNLLKLARQSDTPLHNLNRITYSHFFHYGTSRVLQDALMFYILLNLSLTNNTVNTVTYDSVTGQPQPCLLTRLLLDRYIMHSQDYDAQSPIYRTFFDQKTGHITDFSNEPSKTAFRLLYQFALYRQEIGHPIDWNEEFRNVFVYVLKMDYLFDDEFL